MLTNGQTFVVIDVGNIAVAATHNRIVNFNDPIFVACLCNEYFVLAHPIGKSTASTILQMGVGITYRNNDRFPLSNSKRIKFVLQITIEFLDYVNNLNYFIWNVQCPLAFRPVSVSLIIVAKSVVVSMTVVWAAQQPIMTKHSKFSARACIFMIILFKQVHCQLSIWNWSASRMRLSLYPLHFYAKLWKWINKLKHTASGHLWFDLGIVYSEHTR